MTHRNSVFDNLLRMLTDEVIWIETTLEQAHGVMQKVSASSRYPKKMTGWKFTCSTFTGVGTQLGEVTYLVRVRRTE